MSCVPIMISSFQLSVGSESIYATFTPPRTSGYMMALLENLRKANRQATKGELIPVLRDRCGEGITFHQEKPETVEVYQY